MCDRLAYAIAQFVETTCGDHSLDGWLSENYSWPKEPWSRVKLYADFDNQDWNRNPNPFTDEEQKNKILQIAERGGNLSTAEKNEKNDLTEEIDQNTYRKTKIIKDVCSNQLLEAQNEGEARNIVRFFIRVWGRITRISENTVQGIYESRKTMQNATDKNLTIGNGSIRNFDPFSLSERTINLGNNKCRTGKISSWSKFLSIAHPDWAHIYDTRIAYALNSFIYTNSLHNEKIWPMPEGRNTKIEFLDIVTLIIANQASDRELTGQLEEVRNSAASVNSLKEQLYRADCYSDYLDLLELVMSKIDDDRCESAAEIEAFLFTVADDQVFKEVANALPQGAGLD